jgi:hypothetical protein
MPLGYFGYVKLTDPQTNVTSLLLTNSGGLNRQVNPILSEAVWGAGWYNAARNTNYADGQQHYEGSIAFELQGAPPVWNLIRNWLIERRVYPNSATISPNGIIKQDYSLKPPDSRRGVWISSAGFAVDPERFITINSNVMALHRDESTVGSNYQAIPSVPGNIPTYPLNPGPNYNQNPFPGWSAVTKLTWPGAPPPYDDVNPTTPQGFVLMGADFTFNNNTQVIKGCTGSPNPVAVMQGTMALEGTIRLWRDGAITDPYDTTLNPPFTAQGANLQLSFGGSGASNPTLLLRHILFTSEDFVIAGQNAPVPRTFGFTGLGEGVYPPLYMNPLS